MTCLDCDRRPVDDVSHRCRRHADLLLRRRHRQRLQAYRRDLWRRQVQRARAGLVELVEVTT